MEAAVRSLDTLDEASLRQESLTVTEVFPCLPVKVSPRGDGHGDPSVRNSVSCRT